MKVSEFTGLLFLFLVSIILQSCGSKSDPGNKASQQQDTAVAERQPQPAETNRVVPPETTRTVGTDTAIVIKVYLVALAGTTTKGKKIGCDDYLLPVTRNVKATETPLRSAIQELLAIPHEFNAELMNYWYGNDLKVKSVEIDKGGTATIKFTGELFVAGICDEPRIVEQLEETARQFPTVKKVKAFVNGTPLAEAIR